MGGLGGITTNDNAQHDGFSILDIFKSKQPEGWTVGIVSDYIGSAEESNMTGGIECDVQSGAFGRSKTITAYPANPNSFTMPVQNEAVILFYDEDIETTMYLGPINNTGDIGFAVNAVGTVKMDGEVDDDVELYEFPKRSVFPGETLLQGRYGGSIRLGANVGFENEWSLDGEPGRPVIIIRTGDETVPTIAEDTSTIALLSDQSYPSRAKAPMDYDRPDQYLGSQVIIESGRLVFHSEDDNLILSGQELSLSTKTWSVDFSILMDQMEALIKALMAMTHPTGVGPSGPPINIADFTKIMTELVKMKQ